jgi:predicted porin
MKKSLIALAVASAVSAPAFAATSNVDIYGKLHVSASFVDDQPDAMSDLQFSSNASRIGFKGSEDLGGGLKAIWQIESGVNLDEQNGTWASRNSFVGLAGGFGTVLLGNHDTPFKLVGRSVDLFGDTLADSRNILGGAGTDSSDMRADNVLVYMSPSFSGLMVTAAYSTDPVSLATNAADRDATDVWSVNATYTNGPLFLGAAYSDGDVLNDILGQDSNWRLAGGYTFGNFKVVGQYDSYEDSTAAGEDFDAWMVGASYTMGAAVLKANYIDGEVDNCTGVGCDPSQWTIGADYNLSKRTSVYALYAAGEEGVTLGYGAGTSDRISGGNADGDVAVLSFGVVHTF